MTHNEFIDTLVPLITKYCLQYNYPFVSPILGQAILESDWGTSYKAITGLNFFGLKYTTPSRVPSASGFFYDGGSEQNPDGSYTILDPKTAKWCKFNNYDDAIHGYFEFLTNGYGRYNDLPNATSPKDYLQKIKNAGYATSLKYVDNVYAVIVNNNLTQYDNFRSQKENKLDSLNIIKKTNTHNLTLSKNRSINWIVLHYTANVSSKKGTAESNAKWFSNPRCSASADFIIDDSSIIQYNPDPLNYYSWAVGGKKYTNMSTRLGGSCYGIVKNSNSISIEICSNKKNTATLNASDKDWYFTDSAVNNAVRLTKYLMKQYHIDINHVIMHHMVTGKVCPNPWCVDNAALTKWYDFLGKLDNIQINVPIVETAANYSICKVRVLVPNLNIRNAPKGEKIGKYTGLGVFTITERIDDWGLLKAYSDKRDGWINLSNPSYVQML